MSKRAILKKGHIEHCGAIDAVRKGDWYTPWYLTGDSEYHDKNGGNRSERYGWHVAICNDTSCGAKMIISPDLVDLILRMADVEPES